MTITTTSPQKGKPVCMQHVLMHIVGGLGRGVLGQAWLGLIGTIKKQKPDQGVKRRPDLCSISIIVDPTCAQSALSSTRLARTHREGRSDLPVLSIIVDPTCTQPL